MRGRAGRAASFITIFGPEFGCGQPMCDPSGDLSEGCHPNHECARIVELWNLVFMQFYQDLEGGADTSASAERGYGGWVWSGRHW